MPTALCTTETHTENTPSKKEVSKIELLEIFDLALKSAQENLQASGAESLSGIANNYFAAFKDARDNLANNDVLPTVPGNDPHNVSSNENSPLRVALVGVYGFADCTNYESTSPHSIKTLRSLKPIADAIRINGLSIFT
jgi:hypothetical protein